MHAIKDKRISKNSYYMKLAHVVAERTTCVRRAVGCVLIDNLGHILSTGYNGVAKGMPHCNSTTINGLGKEYNPHACAGSKSKSGTDMDLCEAVHAESNALLQCADTQKIKACYVTVNPCVSCTKLLLNTSCRIIYFKEMHPSFEAAKTLWEKAGRKWTQVL